MKHGNWFWCGICDIHVKNRDDRDFTICRWGEHKRKGGHKKALEEKIAIAELKKRGNTGEILNKKDKKQLNLRKKRNTSPLTALFSKKIKNGGGGNKTPSTARVTNVLNAKAA